MPYGVSAEPGKLLTEMLSQSSALGRETDYVPREGKFRSEETSKVSE